MSEELAAIDAMGQRLTWTEKQYQEWLTRGKRSTWNLSQPVPELKWPEPVRQGPVKTQAEAEYEAQLRINCPNTQILFQAYTLKLAHDTRYTPDFAVVHDNGRIDFHEVKGRYIFAKALNKPKVAARLFTWHKFFLAQKSSAGWKVRCLPPY